MMEFEDIFWSFGVFGIIIGIVQLGLLVMMIWLAFRYVNAHELMADSLRMIAHKMHKDSQERE